MNDRTSGDVGLILLQLVGLILDWESDEIIFNSLSCLNAHDIISPFKGGMRYMLKDAQNNRDFSGDALILTPTLVIRHILSHQGYVRWSAQRNGTVEYSGRGILQFWLENNPQTGALSGTTDSFIKTAHLNQREMLSKSLS